MKNIKKYFLLIIFSVISAVLIGCGGGSEEAVVGDTLTIGVLAPLTGVNAEYGKGFEIATQMAADKINAEGGVNGRKIEFVVKDSKGDQKESSDLARQFVDDKKILAIIGDFTSGACMANAPIVDEAGMVQLSPTASNPDYAGMSDYCFSIMGRQDGEAPFYARYILGRYLGAKKLGVIYINSDWGKSAYDNFAKQAEKDGLEIVEAVSYVQDEKDFSSLITKLRAANPDTICIMDQGEVPQIINQIRRSRQSQFQHIGGGNLNSRSHRISQDNIHQFTGTGMTPHTSVHFCNCKYNQGNDGIRDCIMKDLLHI